MAHAWCDEAMTIIVHWVPPSRVVVAVGGSAAISAKAAWRRKRMTAAKEKRGYQGAVESPAGGGWV